MGAADDIRLTEVLEQSVPCPMLFLIDVDVFVAMVEN
jgi:hypothetical protein